MADEKQKRHACDDPLCAVCGHGMQETDYQDDAIAVNAPAVPQTDEWASAAAALLARFIHLSATPDQNAWANTAFETSKLLNEVLQATPEQPTLPKELLDLIGEYGMARTDFGVGTPSHIKSYSDLTAGIKAYARAALAQAQSCVPAEVSKELVRLAGILRDCGRLVSTSGRAEEIMRTAASLLAAPPSPQPQPVQPSETQWQKRHPLRTEGKWENTNEHDAKWWRDHSQGWEIRVLYAAPVAQAKPEQADHPEQAFAMVAQPARWPLTTSEIADLWDNTLFHITDLSLATDFVRDVEAAHGITKKE